MNGGLAWTVQRSAKRRGCLLRYSQAEPGRELTQPSPRILGRALYYFKAKSVVLVFVHCMHCNHMCDTPIS